MAKDTIKYDDPYFQAKVPSGSELIYVEYFHWENETKGTEGDKVALQNVYEGGKRGAIRKGRIGLQPKKSIVQGLIVALQDLEKELPDEE